MKVWASELSLAPWHMFNRVGNAPRAQPARNGGAVPSEAPNPRAKAKDSRVLQRAHQAKELEYRTPNKEWRMTKLRAKQRTEERETTNRTHFFSAIRPCVASCVRSAAGTAQACSGLRPFETK